MQVPGTIRSHYRFFSIPILLWKSNGSTKTKAINFYATCLVSKGKDKNIFFNFFMFVWLKCFENILIFFKFKEITYFGMVSETFFKTLFQPHHSTPNSDPRLEFQLPILIRLLTWTWVILSEDWIGISRLRFQTGMESGPESRSGPQAGVKSDQASGWDFKYWGQQLGLDSRTNQG